MSHGRRFVLAAIAAGILGAVASAGFQGLDALAVPIQRLADPGIWSTGMAGIPCAVAVLVLAGVVLAVVQVERPGALIDTGYGQVLLVKLVLLTGLSCWRRSIGGG